MDQKDSNRFVEAIEKIDAANAEDPNRESSCGKNCSRELLYSRRMTERLARFAPNASEAVRLAARAQHIRRWEIPRTDFSEGRLGYKKWRTALARFHADTAGRILEDVGYDEATIGRVKDLLQKKRLKLDPEAQLIEDVVCLVFLEYYFEDFCAKHEQERLLDIIRKTWLKMSDRGQEAALQLGLPCHLGKLVEKALAQ